MTSKQKRLFALSIGSLGVVFGDIGTSPLYALKIILGLSDNSLSSKSETIYGLISMLVWTIILVVSIKYIVFIMKANNKGEGGVMALVSLIKNSKLKGKYFYIFMGIIGVALFYGDSVVTPAISVLSAVEGLEVVSPGLSNVVVPVTLALVVFLFFIQRFGTSSIGKIFGPIMLLWFSTIGVAGAWQVFQHPEIISALLPTKAFSFIAANPLAAFVSMGAIILAVTGAEALYADMGHFGRRPIAITWTLIVMPSLILCYMGQGALLVNEASAIENPFFLLFPEYMRFSMVILATMATLIASQAVISGAFSLTRQAIQLNFLPRMLIKQTSARYIGQIYIPVVNLLLFLSVCLLVILFGSSDKLAGAYGVAVSGAMAIDSILFIATSYYFWKKSFLFVALYSTVFLSLDLILVSANIPKITNGGWMPILITIIVLIIISTWMKGQKLASKERRRIEEPLTQFTNHIKSIPKGSIARLPGQAVYIGHHSGYTPAALNYATEVVKELHEKTVILYIETSPESHVPSEERAKIDNLEEQDGISSVTLTYGFHDSPNIPKSLENLRKRSPELDFDPHKAAYFISQSRIVVSKRHNMFGWQKYLYQVMSRNSLSASDYYKLPVENTIEMRTLIKV